MRNVILYLQMTLDGYIGGLNGELDFFEPGEPEVIFANNLFGETDTILFGRNDYEGFVDYWDNQDTSDPDMAPHDKRFVEIFTGFHRVVFSRTLDLVPSNATLIKDNIPEAWCDEGRTGRRHAAGCRARAGYPLP